MDESTVCQLSGALRGAACAETSSSLTAGRPRGNCKAFHHNKCAWIDQRPDAATVTIQQNVCWRQDCLSSVSKSAAMNKSAEKHCKDAHADHKHTLSHAWHSHLA